VDVVECGGGGEGRVCVVLCHGYFVFVLVLFMDLGRKDGEKFWVLKEKGKCRYKRDS
jgi:hypothetical protein